jgi:hypothetical protein
MKKGTLLLSVLLSFSCINAIAMETITYQQATENHITSIVNLINNHAANENDKIVILPKALREQNITDNIADKKLYCAVATNTQEVIAFKKFFIINNQEDYKKILIYCTGEKSIFNKATSFDPRNKKDDLYFNIDIPWSFENSIVIYNGSDYTRPDYRGKKINSFLMEHAFNSIIENVQKIILNKKINYVVLLYGLTHFNAGEDGGIDRTPSIVGALRKFINKISINNTNNIIHKSYTTCMPIYDPESTNKCISFKSIPKYGNVLIFPLNNTIIQ